MPHVLTASSTIQCTHGGSASVSPSQSDALADGSPMLTESDTHTVSGCAFNVSGAPQPCVTIAWSNGSAKVSAGGAKVLTRSSIGQCKGASGAVQGVAIVANTQSKVEAQ
ncbi:MAG TPA: PAAR-like protein [Burkholderiales bacterium]|nr:PAAR-like protein [Burkholderiales bacterium]